MSLTLSSAARSAMATALLAEIDGGSGAATLQVRSGSRPAGPGTTATGDLLLEFTLADPSFTESGGVLTLDNDPVPAAEGEAAGTATWFRILDSDGTAVIDGKVSASGGGGDIIISTTTVSVGLDVDLNSGTLTVGAGTAD